MKRKLSLLLALCCALMLIASPALALKADAVESRHIMEADGTTGQDTNSGIGVKTGHIQDGAVTDAKISGVISGTKLGSHEHSGANLTDGTVTTVKIADGAVTNAKISGVISASKIDGEGLNADMVDGLHAADLSPAVHGHWLSDVSGLDSELSEKAAISHNHESAYAPYSHNHSSQYQEKYANVVVVAKSGGDFVSPIEAINSITDASISNPYLVKIMPGIYDVGNGRVVMKSFVDIEGSGENVTKFLGYTNDLNSNIGLVEGANNVELRNLTVENKNGYWVPCAIFNNNASPKITNVTLISTGSGTGNYGIRNIYNSSPIVTNTTIYVNGKTGQGITNGWDSSPILTNVNIVAESYNGASVGIANSDSSPTLNNVTIVARGGIYENYGVLNTVNSGTSSPIIVNSNISGEGATGIGVYSSTNASVTLFNSIVSGTGDATALNVKGQSKCVNSVDASFSQIICP